MAKKEVKQLTLYSKFSELEKVEPFISEVLANTGEELLGKVQLAVNEAVINALIHGNKQDKTKEIVVTAELDRKTVEIIVKDEGEGFDPDSLPDPTEQEQLLNEGGRGVFLIKQYAAETTFEENGTLVRMKFHIK